MDRNDTTHTNEPIDGRNLQHDDPLDATLPGAVVGAAVGAAGGAGAGDQTEEDVEEADPAATDYPR